MNDEPVNNERRTHHNCLNCKHYFHAGTERWQPGLHCAAFPDRIPWEIFDRRVDHTTPYPGDNGIVYEPLNEAERVELQEARDALLEQAAAV
jgi:hypothetical protein